MQPLTTGPMGAWGQQGQTVSSPFNYTSNQMGQQQGQFNDQMGMAKQKFGMQSAIANKLMGMVGGPGGGSGGSGGGSVGGGISSQASTIPQISAAPIWTPSQINQKVMGSRAANNEQTQGQIQQIGQQEAGRGFGASSPLAQALTGQSQEAGNAMNTKNTSDVQFNTAQGNAQQVLQGQTAQAQAANDAWKNVLQASQIGAERYATNAGLQGSIVGALSRFATA